MERDSQGERGGGEMEAQDASNSPADRPQLRPCSTVLCGIVAAEGQRTKGRSGNQGLALTVGKQR